MPETARLDTLYARFSDVPAEIDRVDTLKEQIDHFGNIGNILEESGNFTEAEKLQKLGKIADRTLEVICSIGYVAMTTGFGCVNANLTLYTASLGKLDSSLRRDFIFAELAAMSLFAGGYLIAITGLKLSNAIREYALLQTQEPKTFS